jgi:hypothetical protein
LSIDRGLDRKIQDLTPKGENFRKAFAGFDFRRVARFGRRHVVRLLKDEGIVRNWSSRLSRSRWNFRQGNGTD